MSMTKEEIIAQMIELEGGYVNDPKDSGGETKYGITQATASRHGFGVKSLTEEQATAIYEADYWAPLKLDDVFALSPKLAEELFDSGVNMGIGRAAEFLQRALNSLNDGGKRYADLKVDGAIGPKTIGALSAFLKQRGQPGERVLFNLLNALQANFYLELAERRPKDERFNYGWQEKRVGLMSQPDFNQFPNGPAAHAPPSGEQWINDAKADAVQGDRYQTHPGGIHIDDLRKEAGAQAVEEFRRTNSKPKHKSKILWTAAATAVTTLATVFGLDVDPEVKNLIISGLVIASSTAIGVMRTKFTTKFLQ